MENNLGFLMVKANIGPGELAQKTKVSRNTIQRLLRKKNASAETMFKIAKYFGKDVEDIFFIENVLHVEHNNTEGSDPNGFDRDGRGRPGALAR
ncbi:helix-turn-helix transcriptional regulator [Paenibacillus phytohabitans]|uniref:helix-turn-helix transcriptional regulator n=1 Tax=Paenibacillus phytohabitans TaxID=2654978 RepID=UPI00300A446B